MDNNPLRKLKSYGQSVWSDFISRGMMNSGELQGLIREDGLSGVTSNPSIFEKAITGSRDYDGAIQKLALEDKDAMQIYEAVTVEDIRRAADLFRPIYERTQGMDGLVSIEVSPRLAYDTEGTIVEARRLWAEVDRPNAMVKVPGTRDGLDAIRRLTGEGININVTLLFGLERYQEVAEAYIAGLEILAAKGKPLNKVTSVASFFLSRIDVLLDPVIEKAMAGKGKEAAVAASVHGQVAIASAKEAYFIYKEIFKSPRFQKLIDQGARSQHVLWASTSTKNPAYSDVKYVEVLIGLDTINTMPIETIEAYRDHGDPAPRLEEDLYNAQRVLDDLPKIGINLREATQQLEEEGVQKFDTAYTKLLQILEEKRQMAIHQPSL